MPQACYAATKGFNNYTVPSTLPWLDHDTYLPMEDLRFGPQDYCLKQLQKTLAYTKALQQWANLAKSHTIGWDTSAGRVYQGIEEVDGAIHHFYWCPGVWTDGALELGMGHPLQIQRPLSLLPSGMQ